MGLRAVIIGDVHARVDDLEDCERLVNVIKEVEVAEHPDATIYLGDLYDSFAMKNVVVERWWMNALARHMSAYIIVGNHDRPGDSSAIGHALQAHREKAYVVEEPSMPFGESILLLPFYFKAADFVAACNEFPQAKTVLCHQSFIGAHFESGLPIEAQHDASAVDPVAIPQKCVIAGHIHSSQHTGKVWYPGSPRWRDNVSDANIERFIHVVDFNDVGLPQAIRKYSTGACRRTWCIEVTPENSDTALAENIKPGDRVVVDIKGPAAFIEQAKKTWTRPGVRTRCFQTDRPGPKLSEADGIPRAWGKWENEYTPKYGTPAERLRAMVKERLFL